MTRLFLAFVLQTSVIYLAFPQSTGINNASPNTKAALDIAAKGKQGFLMPRLATEDTSKIGVTKGKDIGLMFFDTLAGDVRFWDGTKWKGGGAVASGPWEIYKSDIYYTTGHVGIGTKSPTFPLDVQANTSSYTGYLTNTNSKGIGLGVTGGYMGIQATGGAYGVYSSGEAYGVYGTATGSSNAWGGYFSNSGSTKIVALGGDHAATFSGGNVGIGTMTPTTLLHINSGISPAFRLVDGTQGAGKVLIGDVSGNASWATPSSYYSATNVNYASASDLGSTATDITTGNFFSFIKKYADTKLEVHFDSRIRVGAFTGANGVLVEVRIDALAADLAPAAIGITTANSNDYYSSFSVFGNVPAGAHYVRIYARTNAGTCSTILADPGGWGGRITIKETW